MNRKLIVLLLSVAVCACSSDTKQLDAYLKNNYPEYQIVEDGEVVTDSVFCPISKLESNYIELMGMKAQIFSLYSNNVDSAYRMARSINERFGKTDGLGSLTYPKGDKNCKAFTVKCKSDDNERYIVFYKDRNLDAIEYCSLDADVRIDSIMNQYNELMYAVNAILKSSSSSAFSETYKTE